MKSRKNQNKKMSKRKFNIEKKNGKKRSKIVKNPF